MLFGGKNRQKPDGKQEVKSLYPVLHVAGSLKEYQKDLVQKEVASLWELNLVGDSFSSDIAGAVATGIPACWYNPRGKQPPQDIVPAYTIRSLRELERVLS